MATKKIFISYDYSNDRNYKNILLAWSRNEDFDFYINDHSVDVSVNSIDAAAIRRVISQNINAATGFLCIIGKETYKSGWVEWEIEKAKELKKRIIAVKLDKSCPAPLGLLGIGASWALSFTYDAIRVSIDEAYGV